MDSDTDTEQDSLIKIYPYHIIEFISAGRRPKIKKVDIVATKWLKPDPISKKCMVLFPRPPYDEEKSNDLNLRLRDLLDPPSSWTEFRCKIKGRAKSFDEALRKVDELKDKETALTLESGESCAEAEKKAMKRIQQNKFLTKANSVKSTFLDHSSPSSSSTLHAFKSPLNNGSSASSNSTTSNVQRSIKNISKVSTMSQPVSNTSCDGSKRLQKSGSLPSTAGKSKSTISKSPINNVQRNLTKKSSIDSTDQSIYNESSNVSSLMIGLSESNSAINSAFTNKSKISKNNNASEKVCFNSASSTESKEVEKSDSILTLPLQELNNRKSNNPAKSRFEEVMIDCWTNVVNDMKQMKDDMKIMKDDIQVVKSTQIKTTGLDKNFIGSIQQLVEKYQYNIPFNSIEDFEQFDSNLKKNDSLKEDVCNVLQTGLDPSFVISRSIVNMLKMFLCKDVAMQYVAVRSLNKKIMKNTNFYGCIEVIIMQRRKLLNLNTTDREILTALSNVLSNTVSWHKSATHTSTTKSTINNSAHDAENLITLEPQVVQVLAVQPIDGPLQKIPRVDDATYGDVDDFITYGEYVEREQLKKNAEQSEAVEGMQKTDGLFNEEEEEESDYKENEEQFPDDAISDEDDYGDEYLRELMRH